VTEHFIVLVHLDTLRRDDRRARVPDGAAAIAFAGDQHVGGPSKQVVVVDGTARCNLTSDIVHDAGVAPLVRYRSRTAG